MALRAGAALLGGLGGGNLGTLFLTLSANPAALIGGMRQAVSAVDDGGKKILASATKIGVGIAATIGVAAVKAAGDFEESFAGVRKTVDATEQEFKKLEGAFRDMAKTIPVSVNEINKIAEAGGQLGIQKENLVGFTRVMVDLGKSTNLGSEEAATALAQFANVTQMSQKDFDRLASTIVDLGNKSATNERKIVDMATRIAAAGHAVGLSSPDIVSFAAALSSLGIEAELGGSAISRAMIEMAQAVNSGGEDLELFARTAGVSVDSFSTLFKTNATDAILKFVNGLNAIKERGGDLFGTLKNLRLDGIRLEQVMLALSGAGDLVNTRLAIGSKAWKENRAAIEESEKRYQTFYNQLRLTWNQINDILITVGQELVPAISALNEVIKESIGGIDGVSKSSDSWVKDIGPAFIAAVGTVGDIFERLNIVLTLTKLLFLDLAKLAASANPLADTSKLTKDIQSTLASLDKQVNQADFSDRLVSKFSNLNKGIKKETDSVAFNIETMLKKFESMPDRASFSIEKMQKKFALEDAFGGSPFLSSIEGPKGRPGQSMGSIANPKINPSKAEEEINRMFSDLFGEKARVGEAHFIGGLPGADPAAEHLKAMEVDQKNIEAHLKFLQRVSDQELDLLGTTNAKKLELQKAYNEQLQALQLAQAAIVLNSATSIFANLSDITESFGARQSGIYKALFAASKAFAIAESTVKIAQGIAQVSATGATFADKIVGIAAITAATAGIVKTIQSTQLEFGGGRATGGSVTPGKTFLVGERGPELFSPSSAGNITPNNALGGRINIVVNNFTDAQAEVRTTDNGDEKTIEVIIARTKNAIATDIRQGTGEVNRSLQSSFGLKRAGR